MRFTPHWQVYSNALSNRKKNQTSNQILAHRTFRGRPLKNLFNRPGDIPIWRPVDVPICRPGEVPIWCLGDVLKWRPGDVLIWHSRRLSWEVDSRRPLEDLQSTQTWMSSRLFIQNLFVWPNLSKGISTLKMYWEPSETSKVEHFLQN